MKGCHEALLQTDFVILATELLAEPNFGSELAGLAEEKGYLVDQRPALAPWRTFVAAVAKRDDARASLALLYLTRPRRGSSAWLDEIWLSLVDTTEQEFLERAARFVMDESEDAPCEMLELRTDKLLAKNVMAVVAAAEPAAREAWLFRDADKPGLRRLLVRVARYAQERASPVKASILAWRESEDIANAFLNELD
jgi:hypothetical protein